MKKSVQCDWGSDQLAILSAEYDEAMTGCTLLMFHSFATFVNDASMRQSEGEDDARRGERDDVHKRQRVNETHAGASGQSLATGNARQSSSSFSSSSMRGATCSVDIRGGSPGSLMSTDGRVDGILFVGGSTLGLSALDGVYKLLRKARFKYMKARDVREDPYRQVGWDKIPVIRGGADWIILFMTVMVIIT